jgi:hypothetical protein
MFATIRWRALVFVDEQGYEMADEVDKYDEKDVSVHFVLYAQDDLEKAERGERGVPAGTVRIVKSSLKVSRRITFERGDGYEITDDIELIWSLCDLVARSVGGGQALSRVRAWEDPHTGRSRLGRGGRT